MSGLNDPLAEIKQALGDISDWSKPNPLEAIEANCVLWLQWSVEEIEALREKPKDLVKRMVFAVSDVADEMERLVEENELLRVEGTPESREELDDAIAERDQAVAEAQRLILEELLPQVERRRALSAPVAAWKAVRLEQSLWHCLACDSWNNSRAHLRHEDDCFWLLAQIDAAAAPGVVTKGDAHT